MGLHLMAGWSRVLLYGRTGGMYPGEGERVRRRLWLLVLAARIPAVLKKDCPSIANNCIAQLEFVVAHRIRRAQQMFSHYSRMWGDVRLRQIINRITRQFMKRGKEFMIGAAYLSMFKWDSERIPDEEFEKYKDELEICKRLRSVLKGTKSAKGKDEKANPDCKCPSCGNATGRCCWDTFIDEEDLSVWKMEEPSHKGSGLYCYKVFGHYDDVTADDFLSVFLDVEHRKEWDAHVVSLYVVDSEQDTNSDLIYWETKWPVMYSNRDYVFIRRYQIDVERKQMTVLNKSTEHADIPQYHNKTRIQEYWSHMVIRPLVDFDKPGIEFSLTYFDNPGAALPTAITLWISATGMPEYLRNLRLAALKRAKSRELSGGGSSSGGGSPVNPDRKPATPLTPDSDSKDDAPPSGKAIDIIPPPSICPPQERLSPLAAYIHWAKSFL